MSEKITRRKIMSLCSLLGKLEALQHQVPYPACDLLGEGKGLLMRALDEMERALAEGKQ